MNISLFLLYLFQNVKFMFRALYCSEKDQKRSYSMKMWSQFVDLGWGKWNDYFLFYYKMMVFLFQYIIQYF